MVEFTVDEDDDAVVTFEVDSAELPDDLVLASSDGSLVVGRARISLEKALDQLKPSLERIAAVVRTLSPTESSIEFGLKMGGETGIIVAKGSAEANFKLTLAWKPR